jgi:succinate dehydrogenase / fumarate reductase iron-sulfur subunit
VATSVTYQVMRYDPTRDAEAYWAEYRVPIHEGETVLAGLMRIREELDGSLAFRASCRAGICGSDGMVINGRSRLACKTQVSEMVARDGRVVLEPLRNLHYVKDLVVDQTPFWKKFKRVEPYLMPKDPPPERERPMVMDDTAFELLSKASDCIFCEICYSECPINGVDRGFLGPQALIKAYRFEFDPRDDGAAARYGPLSNVEGAWPCRTIFNCTASCPKGIPITHGIQLLKQKLIREAVHGMRSAFTIEAPVQSPEATDS